MLKKIGFLILAIIISSNAFSAVVYNQWSGSAGTSDWNTAGNWALGYVPNVLAPDGINNVKAGFKTATGPVLGTATNNAAAYQITLGGASGGIVTMNGGSLTVTQYLALGVSSTEIGTLVMNSGIVTMGQKLYVGQAGKGTINMTGGTINVAAELSIADTTTANGTVNLNGGTINASLLQMRRSNGGTAKLDIGGGTLILNGDQTAAINGFVSSGILSAYNGLGVVMKDYNVTNAGKTTIWGFLANPKATNPSPSNGAANLGLSVTLGWTAGTSAVSHNVYFGTATPGTLQGNQTEATFVPAGLEYGKTYYWRIDEVNSVGGVTTGDVWSFSTLSGLASNPNPANAAINVSITQNLSWTAAPNADSHNVYFGTSSPGTLQGNQTTTTFNPGTLIPSTTYYWRIDEVVGSETLPGTVWSFTTASSKAITPVPANNATNTSLNPTLSWTAGAGIVSHDVYFGTASPGTFVGNQTGTSYNPGMLAANKTYYWRIDEKDGANNTITGDVWSFTTGNPPTIYPYLSWRNSPTNSMVVNWWNPSMTGDSSIDYGTTASYGSTATNAAVTNFHSVELTGLTPGKTYHYRIRSSDGTLGSDNTFTTSGENVTSFTFAVVGDPRGIALPSDSTMYHTRHKQLFDWMANQNIAFALETGDIVWEGAILNSDPQTKINVESYYTEFFKAEQNFTKTRPVMATMGNHETQPGGRDYMYYNDLYEDAFPTNGTSGNRGKVYSFDYGNAHFVCLSSYQVDLTLQKNWLINDLTAARANPNIKWIFAYMHAPMYTTSGHANRDDEITAWGPIFEQFKVDIVFAGHNHLYERFHCIKGGVVVADREGPMYITNGMSGAEFNNGSSSDPKVVCWYGTSNLNKTVGLVITINGNYLSGQAIPNLTGVPVDTFELLPPYLDGDFDENGTVDANDLGILSHDWLDTGIWP
jgi:hypothetical protein